MQFFASNSHVYTAIGMHYTDANQMYGEKARQKLQKNATSNIQRVLEATPNKTATVRPPTTHHENYQS